MKNAQLLAIAAMVLASASTAAAEGAKGEPGMTAFTQHRCTLCHSIAGTGNKKGPLEGVGSRLSQAEIREWIIDPVGAAARTKPTPTRKPPMKKMAIPSADVDALVALLSALKQS